MKSLLAIFISSALVVSGYAQTRNVLVGTNNTVVQPTNFWSADASNARTGLGLGSAATNPASAFQPSSATLSNLASSNAVNLTNLRATNLVGVIPSSNIPSTTLTNIGGTLAIASGGTGATNASNARVNLGATTVGNNLFTATNAEAARTAIGTLATNGNASGLTNLTAANITGTVGLASNVTGTIAISNGGTGATNAGGARTNLGLGWTALTNTNSATSLMGLVVDTGATNIFYVTGVGSPSNSIIFTNPVELSGGAQGLRITDGTNEAWDFPNDAAAEFYYSFGFYGANASNNAATTRTNLGLPLSALTNTSNAEFNTAIGLGTTNNVQFNTVRVLGTGSPTNLGVLLGASNGVWGSAGPPSVGVGINGTTRLYVSETVITASAPIGFDNATNAATTRTNLGLGWSGLTNTVGTGLVAVNTNGEVVSPTNFWQVAPIVTRFVETQPTTNQTTNIVAARNLHIHSLAISTVGVTNTIALPTNSVFNGDIALVVHQGPTSSVTAIRQAGAGTNLITLNQPEEAVEFVYYNSVWQFNHNLSYVEPIFFSGTNAPANAAASRTNLGLGNISMGSNSVVVTTNFTATNGEARFTNLVSDYLEFTTLFIADSTNTNVIVWEIPTQRTNFLHNLGLGPTNSVTFSDVTTGSVSGSTEESSVQFDQDFLRLSADTLISFESPVEATSTVTAKTNLVVEGFVDYTAARTNNTPTNIPNFAAHEAWIEVKIGTNSFFLPAYQ